MSAFDALLNPSAKPVATKSSGSAFDTLLNSPAIKAKATAAANVAANPAQHVMNPLNPNNQIKQPATSIWSKIGSIMGDIGTGIAAVTNPNTVNEAVKSTFSIPASIVKSEIHPDQTQQTIEKLSGNDLASKIAKPITRAAEPIVEGLGQDISGIFASNEESKRLATEQPRVLGTGKKSFSTAGRVLPPVQLSDTGPITKDDVLNVILHSASVGGALAPIFSGLASDAALGIADTISQNSRVPISYADMQKITASQSGADAIRSVGEEKYRAYKEATKTDQVRTALKQGYVELAQKDPNTFATVLRNAATKPITDFFNLTKDEAAKTSAVKRLMLQQDNPTTPEPFSNETAPTRTGAAQPFANEAPKVDSTLEPFSGKLINQLPDKVIQTPEGFHTIPINAAPAVLSGLPDNITTKSPSQMEALGHENLGPVTTGEPPAIAPGQEGFIAPGQALEDIKATIDKFKENSQTNLEGQRLRTQFVGNKNARIAQTNQMLDSLKHVVKDPVEQEALSLARDFVGKPEELQQFLNGTHPYYQELLDRFIKDNPSSTIAERAAFKQNALDNVQKFKAVIQKALNPSESMTAVNKALDNYYTAKLAEGRKEGVLDSTIDPKEYIAHILAPKTKSFLSGGRLGKKFVNAMERHYPTQLHAIAAGLQPKTLNAFTQTAIYEDRHAGAVATSQFLQQLKTEGLLKFNAATAPQNWRSVKVGNKLVYLPNNMADAVEPLLEESSKPNSLLTGITKWQGTVKAAEVSLSVFHMKALAITSLNADGVPTAMKAVMSNMNSPEFKAQELDFVKHGGTTSMLGKTIEAYRLATKSSIPTRTDLLKKLPGVSQVISLSDKLTHATFDVLQREAKVVSYSTKVAGWMAKNPNATPEQIYNAKTDIAKVENAFYGGLNWETLGVSKLSRIIARGIIFAPDWLYSNILTGKYTFEFGPAGTAARRFWLSSIIFGLIATQMMSLAVSRKVSKHPFQVYFGNDKNGKEMYGNWFFVGAPGDLTKWIDNMHQYGAAVGTAKTIGNKLQSIPRALINLFTNKNYLGQQITIPGASPVVNTMRGVIQFGTDTLPIPFSLTDFAQMLANKKQDYKFWDYLSLIGGTPPSHQVPQGSHVPTTGKNKGKVIQDSAKITSRPQKSFWDQIKTGGSIYQPKKK